MCPIDHRGVEVHHGCSGSGLDSTAAACTACAFCIDASWSGVGVGTTRTDGGVGPCPFLATASAASFCINSTAPLYVLTNHSSGYIHTNAPGCETLLSPETPL